MVFAIDIDCEPDKTVTQKKKQQIKIFCLAIQDVTANKENDTKRYKSSSIFLQVVALWFRGELVAYLYTLPTSY